MNKVIQIIIGILIVMGLITALMLGVCAIGGAFQLVKMVYGL